MLGDFESPKDIFFLFSWGTSCVSVLLLLFIFFVNSCLTSFFLSCLSLVLLLGDLAVGFTDNFLFDSSLMSFFCWLFGTGLSF